VSIFFRGRPMGDPAPPTAGRYFLRDAPFPAVASDLAETVSRFLWEAVDGENVEVEVRLGRMVDPSTQDRLRWPLRTPTVLESAVALHRFESEISPEAYDRVYQYLNARFQEAQRLTRGSPHISYRKSLEQDNFYTTEGGAVRVTVDPADPTKPLRSLRKERKQNVDMFMGLDAAWDIRLTRAEEYSVPPPVNCKCAHARVKERRTYTFDLWKMELTKVRQYRDVKPTGELYDASAPSKITHEVELELDVPALQAERQRMAAGHPSTFPLLVAMAVQYIHGLVAEASRTGPLGP